MSRNFLIIFSFLLNQYADKIFIFLVEFIDVRVYV